MPVDSRADGEHDPLVPGEVDPVQRHQPLPGVRQPGAPGEGVGVVGLAGGGVLGALPPSTQVRYWVLMGGLCTLT